MPTDALGICFIAILGITMAQNATSYKVELSVCDMDRHYYETHKLTVAKHPSETDERLMVRVLAFALNAHEGTVRQNELETRLKGGEVQAKSKPKSRMGKAIASVPKPNAPPTSAMQLISWAGIWCKPAVLWAFRCPTPAGNTLPITKVAQVTGVDLTNPNVG